MFSWSCYLLQVHENDFMSQLSLLTFGIHFPNIWLLKSWLYHFIQIFCFFDSIIFCLNIWIRSNYAKFTVIFSDWFILDIKKSILPKTKKREIPISVSVYTIFNYYWNLFIYICLYGLKIIFLIQYISMHIKNFNGFHRLNIYHCISLYTFQERN